jgi:hypothetical protein
MTACRNCARLLARLNDLEEALGLTSVPANAFVRSCGARILGLLLTHDRVTYSMVELCLYGNKPDCDYPDPKTIPTMVSQLRRFLKEFGFAVSSYKAAQCWTIPKEQRPVIRDLFESNPALLVDLSKREAAKVKSDRPAAARRG